MKESYIFGHGGIFLHELHHTVGQLEGRGKHSKHAPTHTKPTFPEAVEETTGITALILWDYTLQKDRKDECFPRGDACQMSVSASTLLHGLQSFHGTRQVCTYYMRVCVFSQPLPSTEHRGDGGYVCVCLRWKE